MRLLLTFTDYLKILNSKLGKVCFQAKLADDANDQSQQQQQLIYQSLNGSDDEVKTIKHQNIFNLKSLTKHFHLLRNKRSTGTCES